MHRFLFISIACCCIVLSACTGQLTFSSTVNTVPPHLVHCAGLNESAKAQCYDDTFNDVSLCDELTGKKWSKDCYTRTAVVLEDTAICEDYRVYLLDIYDPQKAEIEYRNCYLSVALTRATKELNPIHCDLALTQEGKDNCIWGLYIVSKDERLCPLIVDNFTRTSCEAYTEKNAIIISS